MKNNRIIILIFIFFLLFLFTSTRHTFAISELNEDFNSYTDGSFPNNWIAWPSDNVTYCDSQWRILNGMIGAPISEQSCITNIIPNDEIWGDIGNNYVFEVDMKFITGTDHNLLFRADQNNHIFAGHEIHFLSPGDFAFTPESYPGNYNTYVPGYYSNGNTYHIKIIVQNKNIKVYIDNILVRDYEQIIDPAPTGKIALRSGTGADPYSETWFDNIKVTKIENSDNNFPNVDINVSSIKQTDPAWNKKIYDSANKWNPTDPTINAWGCALTSSVMVLKYHGINKFSNKTLITPSTLNDWLKKQKDGYVGNGLVNWIAISRLSKQSKQVNKITNFDALEFKKINTNDLNIVKNNLVDKIPDILNIPGHFVVAKGINENEIVINDPYYSKSLFSEHNNNLKSINTFTPSFTDLSYIMITTNSNINLELLDENDQKIAEAIIDEIINNPNNSQTNNTNQKTLYFSKPAGTNYKIKISSDTESNYSLNIFLYDKDGNVLPSTNSGHILQNQDKILPLTFLNHDNFYPRKESLNSLSKDVALSFAKRQIKSVALRVEIEKLIVKARIEDSLNQKSEELITLNSLEKIINDNYNSQIFEPAYSKILYDINYLQTHL